MELTFLLWWPASCQLVCTLMRLIVSSGMSAMSCVFVVKLRKLLVRSRCFISLVQVVMLSLNCAYLFFMG